MSPALDRLITYFGGKDRYLLSVDPPLCVLRIFDGVAGIGMSLSFEFIENSCIDPEHIHTRLKELAESKLDKYWRMPKHGQHREGKGWVFYCNGYRLCHARATGGNTYTMYLDGGELVFFEDYDDMVMHGNQLVKEALDERWVGH